MTATIRVTDLPKSEAHIVNYRVPDNAFVVKHDDRVYAVPGDHVHGYSGPDAIELCVYAPDNCLPCAEAASVAQS